MEYWIIFLLTLLNGFFALSEIALVSVKKSRMRTLAESGNKRAKTVLELLERPEDFLSSVQVGITLIGIVSGAYGGAALAQGIETAFVRFGLFAPHQEAVAFGVAIAGITYFSIVVGELVPKSLAMNHAEGIALNCVPILRYFMFLTYPFVKLLGFSTTVLLMPFGVRNQSEEAVGEDELIALLKTANRQGVIEKDEADAHKNLFSFSDLTAKSLLTHRSDLEWVDAESEIPEMLRTMAASSHSKFLVGRGSLDEIVGVLRFRDFLDAYRQENFSIENVVSAPIVITENTPAFKILQAFKRRKQHLALVVDEFWGTAGIVTLHDLIEAIVGNVPDEDDEPNVVPGSEGSYLLSGRTPIRELNSLFDREIIEGEDVWYSTVAGFILGKIGRMPKTGERFEFGDLKFEILDMDGPRIDKIGFSFADTALSVQELSR